MTGAWGVLRAGPSLAALAPRAWLVLRARGHEVVQFDGPLLELMTEGRTRFDQRLAGLGPDCSPTTFDDARFLRRLREDDQTRPIGDALLDQRNVAGHRQHLEGRGLLGGRASIPWRRVSAGLRRRGGRDRRGDAPADARSRRGDGPRAIEPRVYGMSGRPCPRCGTTIVARGQGDDNRTTYWCPGCQR